MSAIYDGALADLVDELGKLPGIGPKSAQRLAFHILQSPAQQVEKLASALTEVKRRVNFCETSPRVKSARSARTRAATRA